MRATWGLLRHPGCDLVIDPLKDLPGYALRRASATAMAGLAQRLAALNVRPTEASVLLIVEANPNITQSEIGKMLNMASANTTTLVTRLTDRNLIEREPVDGRSNGLKLTRAGHALAIRARSALMAHEAALLARVPRKYRSAFLAALRALWQDTERS